VAFTCLQQQRERGSSTCTFRHGVRSVIYSAGERKVGGMEPSETPRVIESWLRNLLLARGMRLDLAGCMDGAWCEVRVGRSSRVEGQKGFPTTLSGLALARGRGLRQTLDLISGSLEGLPGSFSRQPCRTLFTVLAIWHEKNDDDPIETRGRRQLPIACMTNPDVVVIM